MFNMRACMCNIGLATKMHAFVCVRVVLLAAWIIINHYPAIQLRSIKAIVRYDNDID